MSGVHPLSETTLPGHSTLTKQTLRIPCHDVKIGKSRYYGVCKRQKASQTRLGVLTLQISRHPLAALGCAAASLVP